MRYDLLYLQPLQGEEAPGNEVKAKIASLLKSFGATTIREEDPGRRKLAYPISRARYAFYGNVVFEAEPVATLRLRDALSLETSIMRFQIVQEEQTAPRKLKPTRVRLKRPVTIPTAVPAPIVPAALKPKDEKVNLEELDKKLEELLSDQVTP